MTTVFSNPTAAETVADLMKSLGGVPASRVRLWPAPGQATEQDVIEIEAKENRLFELIDGTLVEKGMGYLEAVLAAEIAALLRNFVRSTNIGVVAAADGMMRILPRQVRIPDVSYTSRQRLPDGRVPRTPIPAISPDLAVEILSDSNTPREMDRKRREYFESGTRLVWIVDPKQQSVAVYTSPESHTLVDVSGTLDGGDVLPGFTLELAPLFALLDG